MTKLTGSVIMKNELGRYLPAFLTHVLSFCDEVRVIDDGSTDGTSDFLMEAALEEPRLVVERLPASVMFDHEGRARNLLLDFTLVGRPTHVLAIDADEFVSEPRLVRQCVEGDDGPGLWTLNMEEVWKADSQALWTRQDGGWRTHACGVLWKVPVARKRGPDWHIQDRQLACGREPMALRKMHRQAIKTGAALLHFGWAIKEERTARYQRYVEKDGGAFHSSQHLKSIMWPDERVRFASRPWPGYMYEEPRDVRKRLLGA